MNPLKSLRDTTLQQRLTIEEKPITHASRRHVPIEDAATVLQYPHDCSHNPDAAHDKAQRRIEAVFIRFAFTQLVDCSTTRVSTDAQAGHSQCGKCQCAHWATTSALRDDKMPRVLVDITNNQVLTPKKEFYIKVRLGLSTPETKRFKKLTDPQIKVDFIRSNISPNDLRNSFHQTAYYKQLSSTIEGPKAANDFDQKIEGKFRPQEDFLSEEVAEGRMDYKQATLKAYKLFLDILQKAHANISLRMKQIITYNLLEKKLYQIEEIYYATKKIKHAQVEEYSKLVNDLLELRTNLLLKQKFCINFKTINFSNISHREDFFHLKGFRNTMQVLDEPRDHKQAFKLLMGKIKRNEFVDNPPILNLTKTWLAEAQGQLTGLTDLGLCNLNNLETRLFGIKVEGPKGPERRAPTEAEFTTQLIEMTAKEKIPKNPKKRKRKALDL